MAIEWMTTQKLKQMPSMDAPGKLVGDLLPAKRLRRDHPQFVADVRANGVQKPVTIVGGKVKDGHHRIAAAEDAARWWVPVERSRT